MNARHRLAAVLAVLALALTGCQDLAVVAAGLAGGFWPITLTAGVVFGLAYAVRRRQVDEKETT